MRLAVLLCGVMSGVAGLGFGWWGEQAALVHVYGLTLPVFVSTILAIHVIGVVCISGGLAVLVFPRLGGTMMLASAVGWLLIVALLGGGLGLSIAGLIAVSGAGGLMAFLPSINRPAFVIERAGVRAIEQPRAQLDHIDTRDWVGPLVEEIEDHSRPYLPPIPEVTDDDRRSHRPYAFHNGELQQLTYKLRRKRKSLRGRTIAGLTALAVVLIGVPALLVIDFQMRVPKVVSAPVEAVVEGPAPVAKYAPSAEPTRESSSVEPSSTLAALPMPSAAYATPFDYCTSIGNADIPALTQIGEGLPKELIDGVRQVTNMPDGEVRWRCMDNAVWICAQPVGGLECGQTPNASERTAYCEAHPNEQGIEATAGEWACRGRVPMIPQGFERTVDPRGFDRLAWLSLSKAPVGGVG